MADIQNWYFDLSVKSKLRWEHLFGKITQSYSKRVNFYLIHPIFCEIRIRFLKTRYYSVGYMSKKWRGLVCLNWLYSSTVLSEFINCSNSKPFNIRLNPKSLVKFVKNSAWTYQKASEKLLEEVPKWKNIEVGSM